MHSFLYRVLLFLLLIATFIQSKSWGERFMPPLMQKQADEILLKNNSEMLLDVMQVRTDTCAKFQPDR
ncbi:hypothetical protein L596_025048 [Steinernema carpocapsae]|uniref:Peptidase M12A domain-containing protein n=1 Tax=Steinernema carpocapsae TaxID=34508 RepID=A0A4V5ZYX8_STECR|nr:hypothetical protein L596_025048 [Steinernema carpocapsae]